MGLTAVEKILAKASETDVVPGDIITAKVDTAMSHENAGLVIRIFKEIGVKEVWDPSRIVLIFDHRVPANTIQTAETHKQIREFANSNGIANLYDINKGICHQVMHEEGHVRMGELIVGTDSHTPTYGAFGAYAMGIGATEMASVWATGELWFNVPATIKINVEGSFQSNVMSKDLALEVVGKLGSDGANFKAIEFTGSTIDKMSVSDRIPLTNLAAETGATTAFIQPNEHTIAYLKEATGQSGTSITSDPDAVFTQNIIINAEKLKPKIATPHSPANVKNVQSIEGIRIDQAFLGSCTNGRLEDLVVAAKILAHKRIHSRVRLIVIPASWRVYIAAMQAGILETIINAGGVIANPGCGPCLGAHLGLLASGEVCISSSNRNYRGRMGSPEAEIYLASPKTVAASAVSGEITVPMED
ncbi:MAG: 3-isopropylmalate dehydratase large subunit [Candidatus Ranarchaeia archaeon]|jgi:3-isopropylmalate/(R)-2-methylmalate dehydratase large subunit